MLLLLVVIIIIIIQLGCRITFAQSRRRSRARARASVSRHQNEKVEIDALKHRLTRESIKNSIKGLLTIIVVDTAGPSSSTYTHRTHRPLGMSFAMSPRRLGVLIFALTATTSPLLIVRGHAGHDHIDPSQLGPNGEDLRTYAEKHVSETSFCC